MKLTNFIFLICLMCFIFIALCQVKLNQFVTIFKQKKGFTQMVDFDKCLDEVVQVDGVLCCSIVDSNSGMMMAQRGSGVDLEIASAGNTEVVRAKLKTMDLLGLNDYIEDMLITLGKQYHVIRPIRKMQGTFIYAVLDRKASLAMARRQIQDAEAHLDA